MKFLIGMLCTVGLLTACGGGDSSAPSNLTGAKMGSGFHLNWVDNSADEEEFVVEQKVGDSAFQEVARVPFNTTEYMVETGTPGEMYMFRVLAALPATVSAPSNEVMWTP